MEKTTNFREYHIEKLKNAAEAKLYLNVALEEFEKDQDTEAFLLAQRDIAEAQGGDTKDSIKTQDKKCS